LLFYDFTTGTGGDAIDFLQLATGLSRDAAFRKFLEMAGGSAVIPAARRMTVAGASQRRERPRFPTRARRRGGLPAAGTASQSQHRGIQLAGERGLLWFGSCTASSHGLSPMANGGAYRREEWTAERGSI